MPACEMCGKDSSLVKARIEGAELEVCNDCARYGQIISKPAPIRTKTIPERQNIPLPRRKERIETVVQNYAQKIKNAREKLGLTQEEFSKKLNERESIMQKIESGHFTPSIEQARKLEKELGINLIENFEEGEVPISTPQKTGEAYTLGDFIKTRKKKE